MSRYKLPPGMNRRFKECGIPLIRVYTEWESKQIGIHLLCPTREELGNALEKAMQDGYPQVLVHDFATWAHHHGYHRKPEPKLTIACSSELSLRTPMRAELRLVS